jgi:hypothetical protein
VHEAELFPQTAPRDGLIVGQPTVAHKVV